MKIAIRADYILENSETVHTNSVLISEDGFIQKIIPFDKFNSSFVDNFYDEPNSILTPGFVNCHTHLELSAIPKIETTLFTEWIMELVKTRFSIPEDIQYEKAIKAIEDAQRQGTVAFGDITNSGMLIDYLNSNNIPNFSFIEVLGFEEKKCDRIISDLDEKFQSILNKYENTSYSPHAPYSMSYSLLKKIKSDRLQTIHIDEALSERKFLKDGIGEFKSFLQKINVWDENWKIPNQSPYEYISNFNYLENTLLVHSLNFTESDIELIKDSTVVICARSNEHLHSKSPNIKRLLDNNIKCALGTDSLASCDDLSILNEMKHIYRTQNIDPKILFKMATEDGANALQLDEIGTLGKNKRFMFNSFSFEELTENPFEQILNPYLKQNTSFY